MTNIILLLCLINLCISTLMFSKMYRKNEPEAVLLCMNAYMKYLENKGTITLLDVFELCAKHNVDFSICESLAFSLSTQDDSVEEETYLS